MPAFCYLQSSLDAKAEDVFSLIILHPEDASRWGGNITSSYVSCSPPVQAFLGQ